MTLFIMKYHRRQKRKLLEEKEKLREATEAKFGQVHLHSVRRMQRRMQARQQAAKERNVKLVQEIQSVRERFFQILCSTEAQRALEDAKVRLFPRRSVRWHSNTFVGRLSSQS